MSIKIEKLLKNFGTKKAVDNISFEIMEPGIFGLLGTNGAGKTTTIRMILGIISKDSGNIYWNDKELDRDKIIFGYLPEERGIYPKVKVIDQLRYFGKLRGMNKIEIEEAISKWSMKLKVSEYLDMLADKLSKGNQQKVQFLCSIIHNPELIILDEPFSGLDPVNTELLKNIIIELVNEGKYIIMSAHEMHTIEEFCSNILILNRGKTILKGNIRDIKNKYPANHVIIETNEDISSTCEELGLVIKNKHDNIYFININNEEDGYNLISKIISSGIKVNKFSIEKPTLNEIFIEKVGESNE